MRTTSSVISRPRRGRPRVGPMLGTIELVRDELVVPAEDCVGLGNGRDPFERITACHLRVFHRNQLS